MSVRPRWNATHLPDGVVSAVTNTDNYDLVLTLPVDEEESSLKSVISSLG